MLRELPTTWPRPIPRQSYISYEEYLQIAPENRLMEWVDGEIIEHMSASTIHQDYVSFLFTLINLFVGVFRLGKVYTAPYEVKLWDGGPAREPDILFVQRNRVINIDDQRLYGGPDLAVEIISPSSVRRDRFKKFGEYEKAGVKEYWLIDPRSRQLSFELFVLEDVGGGKMEFVRMELDENGRFHSKILPGFWLNIDWLLAAALPDPGMCVADVLRGHDGIAPEDRAAYEVIYKMYNRRS